MDEITQIKQNINIVDLIGTYIELKKAGKNYKGNCPFHGEKTPSFMVSPDLQIYKCFGCGEAGDIFSFIQKIEGIEFVSALEQLAEKAGVKIEKKELTQANKDKSKIYEINETAKSFYHQILTRTAIGKEAKKYFIEKRKLTDKTLADFQLGYAPNTWDTLYKVMKHKGFADEDLQLAGVVTKKRSGEGYIDKFRNRIMFPFTGIDGKTIGFTGRVLEKGVEPKYLNTQETPVFQKNSFLYGLDKAKIEIKQKGAVFVEGNMDVIAAHQAGINNVIATSGTSLTVNQLLILKRYTNDLVFCFDSDVAGQNATLRAIELAEENNFNIKIGLIPSDVTDLDELINKNLSEAKKIISDAIPIYDFFISNSLNSYDKHSPIGKKQIMESLAPKIGVIKNPVLIDHYKTKLADILEINEGVIGEILEQARKKQDIKPLTEKIEKNQAIIDTHKEDTNLHRYLLSLLIHAQLAIAQNVLYKLSKNDFPENSTEQEIFVKLKELVVENKTKFDIKKFVKKLEDEEKTLSEQLYLKDLGELHNNDDKLDKELQTTFKRLKYINTDTQIRKITKSINEAEEKNDKETVESLAEKVNKLSKLKKQYGQYY